jgi:hypothetical protein
LARWAGRIYAFREIPPLANQDGGMAGANIRVGLLFNPASGDIFRIGAGRGRKTGSAFASAKRRPPV